MKIGNFEIILRKISTVKDLEEPNWELYLSAAWNKIVNSSYPYYNFDSMGTVDKYGRTSIQIEDSFIFIDFYQMKSKFRKKDNTKLFDSICEHIQKEAVKESNKKDKLKTYIEKILKDELANRTNESR